MVQTVWQRICGRLSTATARTTERCPRPGAPRRTTQWSARARSSVQAVSPSLLAKPAVASGRLCPGNSPKTPAGQGKNARVATRRDRPRGLLHDYRRARARRERGFFDTPQGKDQRRSPIAIGCSVRARVSRGRMRSALRLPAATAAARSRVHARRQCRWPRCRVKRRRGSSATALTYRKSSVL